MKRLLGAAILALVFGGPVSGRAEDARRIEDHAPRMPVRTLLPTPPPSTEAGPTDPADWVTTRVYGQIGYLDPDGRFVPAVNVKYRVYEWGLGDQIPEVDLAFGTTDANGIIDIDVDRDFHWAGENSRVQVEVSSIGDPYFESSLGTLQVNDPLDHRPYTFIMRGPDNSDGTLVLLGTQVPWSEHGGVALHLASQSARAMSELAARWYSYLGLISVRFPVEGPAEGTFFPEFGASFSLPLESAWRDDHLFRLLGHSWHRKIATWEDHDLCNGSCDSVDCGFCDWCPEEGAAVWNEGFALYFADLITGWLDGQPGPTTLNAHGFEDLESCGPIFTGPDQTPGYTAALLHDLNDLADASDDHPQYPGWVDAVGGLETDIWLSMVDHGVNNVADLLDHLIADQPQLAPAIWETAMNCGFDADSAAPGAVTALASTSHTISQGSEDATIDLTWGAAIDDASGIAGYALSWNSTPTMPPEVMNVVGDVTSCSSAAVPQGIWYLNLRSVDRAGKWSPTFRSVGPFAIQTAPNIDFEYVVDAGWDYVSFPSQGFDNTTSAAHVTPVLIGDLATNHLNIYGWNAGPADTDSAIALHVQIDGAEPIEVGIYAGVIASQHLPSVDHGSFHVPGGRHNFVSVLEGRHIVTETDEDNNFHGRQFVWTGAPLTAGVPTQRAAPPFLEAGGEHVPSAAWFVCDGLSFQSDAWWSAVVVRPLANDISYAARLHRGSTGSEDGFAANLAFSARPQGTLNGVIVNRNTMGDTAWDVGVLNGVWGGPDYEAMLVTSTTQAFGDSIGVTLAAGRRLVLREVYIAPADTGHIDITVSVVPAQAGVGVNWLGRDFQTGTLLDGDAVTWTDADGRALVEAHVPLPGYHCLVIYRDDLDVSTPLDLVVESGPAMADMVVAQPAGWAAPLVPRPANDGLLTDVAVPDTLHGNVASTWINYASGNAGYGDAANSTLAVSIDGATIRSIILDYPAGIEYAVNRQTPYSVRGGRHMATLVVDVHGAVEEFDETNNLFGRSWVWSPLPLSFGSPLTRSSPPDPVGGMDVGGLAWFNCDGLRQPAPTRYWTATAVMPRDAEANPDVRLHPVSNGTESGFGEYLTSSNWGAGESDFVLTNHNYAAAESFDVGVVRGSVSAESDYQVETVEAAFLSLNSTTYGPFAMGADEILDLYEFQLSPGIYHFVLENESGAVDWGMSLHRQDLLHQGKSSVVDGGAAWMRGPGQNEYMDAVVPDLAFACLSVWKRGTADLPLAGTYSIRIQTGISGTEDQALPSATRLAGAAPNPFNPSTTVAYELADAGRVMLAVYDLTGARIAELVNADRPAGRHQALWTGRSASGRGVASGVYFARLSVDGRPVGTEKLVLLK